MSVAQWDAVFADNPQMLWGLISDMVKAIKASEGERRTGRRRAATVASTDELFALLFPVQYETRPFAEAFASLIEGKYTQRAFATYFGFNQATISRLLAGKLRPSVETMERIAIALRIQPMYFAEYRAAKLAQVLSDLFLAHPEVSAHVAQRLRRAGVSA